MQGCYGMFNDERQSRVSASKATLAERRVLLLFVLPKLLKIYRATFAERCATKKERRPSFLKKKKKRRLPALTLLALTSCNLTRLQRCASLPPLLFLLRAAAGCQSSVYFFSFDDGFILWLRVGCRWRWSSAAAAAIGGENISFILRIVGNLDIDFWLITARDWLTDWLDLTWIARL